MKVLLSPKLLLLPPALCSPGEVAVVAGDGSFSHRHFVTCEFCFGDNCNVCFGLAESVLKLCKLGAKAKSICDEDPHVRSLHRSTVMMRACECCWLGGWMGFGSCGCAQSADIGCHGARPG